MHTSCAPLSACHSTHICALLPPPPSLQVLQFYLPELMHKVHLVSNIFELPAQRAEQGGPPTCVGRRGLLFVGNYNHKPNVQAVMFLLKHVLPRIR